MLIRTHLTITLMAILFLIDKVEAQYTFVAVALIATFLPDIDTAYSKLGKEKIFRPLQVFVKHRGFIHSFSFLFLIVLAFVLFWPVGALGFFIGYSLHLFLDAFTVDGIKPFYPWGKTSSGKIRTGGKIEIVLFLIFVLIDLFLAVRIFVDVY